MYLYDKNGKRIGELYADVESGSTKLFTSKEKLKKIFYSASSQALDEFYKTFNEYAYVFDVSTEFAENAFLAQIVAETGNSLISVRENLNYTPSALMSVFSYYKGKQSEAEADGRYGGHSANQENIGNKAYANRIGNGDIASGDGYKYRGGGFFQLTGRGNYDRMGKVIQMTIGEPIDGSNIVSEIEKPSVGVLTALAFWLDNDCSDCIEIDCVTQKINRYTDSYEKRKETYQWIASID